MALMTIVTFITLYSPCGFYSFYSAYGLIVLGASIALVACLAGLEPAIKVPKTFVISISL